MKKAFLLSTIYCLLSTGSVFAQSVDILWSGDGYVPPFYQGGMPWTQEGIVRLFAVPQGLGNPGNLFYKWSRNGTVLGNTNGVGKNSLTISDSIFSKPISVTVEILSSAEEVLASSAVTLVPAAPELLVYEKNPLYGFLFNAEASGGYRLPENEITFAAFPLFFTMPVREHPALRYSWRSNAGDETGESLVTYRVPENAGGMASVSVSVSDTNSIRQKAERSFLVQFGDDNQ